MLDLDTKGCWFDYSENGFQAVLLYEDPKVRAILIPQYRFGTSWMAAGNKRKFERIKFLAQHVSKCIEYIRDINQPGSSSEWMRTIRICKDKWSVKDGTRMTPLIQKIKDIEN